MKQVNAESVEQSPALHGIREEMNCAIRSDAKVLITGDNRIGSDAIARLIHQRGDHSAHPFVTINCSAHESSSPSELFGHQGLLQQARTGTVFIDNIDDMSARTQSEFVGFLDSGASVRIIAATSGNLYESMLAGRFREDLYHRLNIIHIVLTDPSDATILPGENRQSLNDTNRPRLGKAV